MTHFDVQQGKVVGRATPAPEAVSTQSAKKPHAFHIGRYEAQQKRRKQVLAKKLLQLAFPNRQITFNGDDCRVEATVAAPNVVGIHNYLSRLCDHIPADVWEKLPRTDRYDALHMLIPQEYRTPVPGGMVYQVRFKSRGVHEEWVMLTVGHEIGRCKLVPLVLSARVF